MRQPWQKLTSLTYLDLSNNNIRDNGAEALANLTLNSNGRTGITALCEVLKSNRSLKRLNLCPTGIGGVWQKLWS